MMSRSFQNRARKMNIQVHHKTASAASFSESSDMLVLNLTQNCDGTIYTRNVEFTNSASKVKINMKNQPNVRSVFSDEFIPDLLDIIKKAATNRMLMMKDLAIDLGNVFLQGCRVMFTPKENGVEFVMVRFVRVIGDFCALLKAEYSARQSQTNLNLDCERYALEQVFMPLFNFANYIESVLEEPNPLPEAEKAFLSDIREKIVNMRHSSDWIGYLISCQAIVQQRLQTHPIEQLEPLTVD